MSDPRLSDQALPRRYQPMGEARAHYMKALRMARSVGLDLAEAQRVGALPQDLWAGVVTQCRACGWSEGCSRYLSRMDGSDTAPARAAPEGCPNRAIYDRLVRDMADPER